MVGYKHILQAMDEYVQKCSVTLKDVRAAIEPLIDELVGDDYVEKKVLMEDIPRFYRDAYTLDRETCVCYSHDGILYENKGGSRMEVGIPEEAVKVANREGLMYGMHNHPVSVGAQSEQDFMVMAGLDMKYSICCGKGSITIAKKEGDVSLPVLKLANAMHTMENMSDIKKNADNLGITKIRDDYSAGKISKSENNSLMEKALTKYFNDNFDSEVSSTQTTFDNFDIPIKYVGIKL